MSFRVGDRIADYEVVGMLGAGGMGAVYQVRHLISDRLEAMKVLLPDLEANAELAERFIREIRLQASLSHPNIASLHNALRENNQLLMIMEFVDGETLASLSRRQPLEPLQAVEVITYVLAALAYAHSRSVIHRDVKPSNVMISSGGLVKLMDFGIARAGEERTQLTQAGAAIGSMYYMSPEQIEGGRVDARSDIYATGITLFEVLAGAPPFKGGSAAEIMQAHLQRVPPSPGLLNPAVPEPLSRIVLKAIEKNPAHRFQQADEFRDALLALVASERQSHREIPTVLASQQPYRERTPTPSGQSKAIPVSTPASGSQATQPVHFDPLGLERVRKELAIHIGPMAKVLVDRAARRARTWQELYTSLAPEIQDEKQRKRFVASAPRG